MDAGDYQKMSEAMDATIAEYPAETEGAGNQVLEPHLRAGGVKEFELTAEVTSWEVEPGQQGRRLDLQRHSARAADPGRRR